MATTAAADMEVPNVTTNDRGREYAGKGRQLYAVSPEGFIVGSRTTARVYSHALVVRKLVQNDQGRTVVSEDQVSVLSWHLGEPNAMAKRRLWDAYSRGNPVLYVARVVDAPAGRPALEALLASCRAAVPSSPPFPTPHPLDAARAQDGAS